MNTVRLKCDCSGKLIFFLQMLSQEITAAKPVLFTLDCIFDLPHLYLQKDFVIASGAIMCLPPQMGITLTVPSITPLSMDWNRPPRRVNPPRRHGSFTSTTPTSLPSFYSNPMSYRRLSEVSFLSPWCCSGRVFPNPSRRFLWLTENRTLSYSESKLDCTKEWKQKSKKMVRKGMLSSTQSSEISEIIYSIDLISRPKKPDCSKCSRFFFGLLLCKSETCNYFLMNTMQTQY